MNQDYIKPDNWSIIEEDLIQSVKSSEVFSMGNGYGVSFEESYTGKLSRKLYCRNLITQTKKWVKNVRKSFVVGIDIEINRECS
jgi:maltose phosphorylase